MAPPRSQTALLQTFGIGRGKLGNRSHVALAGPSPKEKLRHKAFKGKKMQRLMIAFQAFFAALASAAKAEQIQAAIAGQVLPKINAAPKPQHPVQAAAAPARSEAITLLAALQREARFVDLVKQPLGQFSDEQIGSAAREVLTGCVSVLDRFFSLQPVSAQEEGSSFEVPKGYDPAEFKLAGPVEGAGPFRGKLVHAGWRVSFVKLPAWTGSKESATIVAPAEVDTSADS